MLLGGLAALEVELLGSLDQPGGGVQSLGLVDHSDELMRRRLGGINVKPCLGDVGRGLYMGE